MAEIDQKTIRYLAKLSRIHCTEEEETALLQDLKKILSFVDELDQVNTDHVSEFSQVIPMSNTMREDEIGKTLSREEFLANSPSHTGGMIRVPPVLKS